MSASSMLLGVHGALIRARLARKITQEQIGAVIGRDRFYVSRVENGHGDIRLQELCAWADFLGVELIAEIRNKEAA